MKKNNAWNIRRLLDESFVPSTQHIILKIVGFQDPVLLTVKALSIQNAVQWRTKYMGLFKNNV